MSLEQGSERAVKTCMNVSENDKVAIVSDEESKKVGQSLREAALDITPHVRFFNLDIYGERPLSELPDRVRDAAENSDVTFWTARSFEGELPGVRRPFIKAALKHGRHAHMVDVTEDIMKKSMAADYNDILEFTEKMYDILKDSEEMRVTNPQGTDFTARFGDMRKWVSDTGICHQNGSWTNLPSGEIFTAPKDMEGKIVIDGVLSDHLGEKFPHSILQETPLTIRVDNQKRPTCTSIESENEDLRKAVEEELFKDDCSRYVGEIGLGTNIFLESLIDNMLQDEKYPSVHIGFGDPMAEDTYAGWTCEEHHDMVLTECDVWVDGDKLMEDGDHLVEP